MEYKKNHDNLWALAYTVAITVCVTIFALALVWLSAFFR